VNFPSLNLFPQYRDTRRLLIHAFVGILNQCDNETLPIFVRHLFGMITERAWIYNANYAEDPGSSNISGDLDANDITRGHHYAHGYRAQVCLGLVLRELQGVLLVHLGDLFDERLQRDVFPRSLAVDGSEEGFVLEFCFELHHRIGKQSWNEDLMMEVMYCLAICNYPTNSMSLFLKECFESEGSSRAVEVFQDCNGVEALWSHARSKGKDNERRKIARSILFSYFVTAAQAPPNVAHSVFELEFDRLKNTDIFIIVVEKIFAELLKTWDQRLEMPSM
jgi:hypothetical protein